VSTTLFENTLPFILGLFYGNATVGYYSIADKIVRAAINLSIPVSQGIYPRVNTLFAETRVAALAFLRKTLLLGGVTFLLVSVALFLGADIAVRLVMGESNDYVSMLIRIMAIAPLVIFLANIYGTQILIPLGMKKEFMQTMILSGLFAIVTSFLLIPPFAAVGAALALVLSAVLALVLQVIAVRKTGIKISLRGS
jgi:polysaccharide transporter, PST family